MKIDYGGPTYDQLKELKKDYSNKDVIINYSNKSHNSSIKGRAESFSEENISLRVSRNNIIFVNYSLGLNIEKIEKKESKLEQTAKE